MKVKVVLIVYIAIASIFVRTGYSMVQQESQHVNKQKAYKPKNGGPISDSKVVFAIPNAVVTLSAVKYKNYATALLQYPD
jgi:hypothetical protein